MKYYDKLKQLLDEELGDYSAYSYEIHHEESLAGAEYYSVDIIENDKVSKTISFRNDASTIKVELSEGSYYEIESFDYSIKYFWMALLS